MDSGINNGRPKTANIFMTRMYVHWRATWYKHNVINSAKPLGQDGGLQYN